MKKIAIIAAMPGELKPLVRGWAKSEDDVWTGRIGAAEVVAVAGGMGAAAADRAVERVFADGIPDAVVSYGWAGALTCAVKPPAVCVISEVVDAASGELFATKNEQGYRLITLDHVARGDEKRGLAAKHKSVLVDMEAAAVARSAAARGVDFYCFKGISDGYNDVLPDFNLFMDGKGALRLGAFVAYAVLRPKYWASLQRLGANSGAAAAGLARTVKESFAALP
jgi:adenosylhomocysteine nucleosidase